VRAQRFGVQQCR